MIISVAEYKYTDVFKVKLEENDACFEMFWNIEGQGDINLQQ
jgi:hypothetical protein